MENPAAALVERVGGQSALAALLGIKQQSIYEWVKRKRIPAERVVEIESATGIPRHDLRPDLYPEKRA
jgi:DNA-binding transcriptional regulator YdaS (Cro superfamily)